MSGSWVYYPWRAKSYCLDVLGLFIHFTLCWANLTFEIQARGKVQGEMLETLTTGAETTSRATLPYLYFH